MAFFGLKKQNEENTDKVQDSNSTANLINNYNERNVKNIGKGSQFNFYIPFFDVYDPRFTNQHVPVSVHGSIVYGIEDMQRFLDMNAMQMFNEDVFNEKLMSSLIKYVKGVVSNVPMSAQIPVLQLDRKIMEISEIVTAKVIPQVERIFGINVRNIDVTNIEFDRDSRSFKELNALTTDLERENTLAQHSANLSNFKLQNTLQQDQMKSTSSLGIDAQRRQQELQLGGQEEMQRIQLENQRETMRIQREEMQRASKLQTEQTFLGAHQANLNSNMFNTAVENLGGETAMGMAGMMGTTPSMPGAATTMASMAQAAPAMPGMAQTAPPMPGMAAAEPDVAYLVAVNGQQAGPFNWQQLQQLKANGQLTAQTYVWAQGMPQWQPAGQVLQLMPLFAPAAPSMPGMGGGNAF